MKIEKPTDSEPIVATICGDAGMGKTSFAALFPKPLFIKMEDGMKSIPIEKRPDSLPMVKSADDLWAQLSYIIKEVDKDEYKTLVFDSVTALEQIFIEHVIASDPKQPKTINQANGGYGAGLAAVGGMHARLRRATQMLIEEGMNIVFIAHCDTETIEQPDSDAYTRYTLRLGKRSMSPYIDNVDLVGFIKLETFTTGDGERKKAISDGTRVLVTYATACNVSKNRYGISEDLEMPVGVNPLVKYVKCLNDKGDK